MSKEIKKNDSSTNKPKPPQIPQGPNLISVKDSASELLKVKNQTK